MTPRMAFRWQAPWLSGDQWIELFVGEEARRVWLDCGNDSHSRAMASHSLTPEQCEELATNLCQAAAIVRAAARCPE